MSGPESLWKKDSQDSKKINLNRKRNPGEMVNPKRREEKQEMLRLGFKTKKSYRKYLKKKRREE